jgi:hypothetical protein
MQELDDDLCDNAARSVLISCICLIVMQCPVDNKSISAGARGYPGDPNALSVEIPFDSDLFQRETSWMRQRH